MIIQTVVLRVAFERDNVPEANIYIILPISILWGGDFLKENNNYSFLSTTFVLTSVNHCNRPIKNGNIFIPISKIKH